MSSEEHPKAESRESDDTSATPPSEFKEFGRFPQELQDLIWRAAALSVPRLYIVRARVTCIDSGVEHPWVAINPCEEVKQRTRRLKPLLLACKMARKEVLRTLPPPLRFASCVNFFGSNQELQTGQIHFDVEADVLCIVQPFMLLLNAPVCRGGPMAPDIRQDFKRIKNLGLQAEFAVPPSEILSQRPRGWPLRVFIPFHTLHVLGAFIAAARFYLVAPPHVRKAPKPPPYHEGSFGNRPKERHGDTHAEDDQLEVGYMSHGPMWSNNPLLRSLQMTATPGSFGKTGQFGFTRVPVQQVQHVYVTEYGQDLSPTLLSLWLSLCCRPDTYDEVRRRIWVAQFWSQFTGLPQRPVRMVQYCGVLLPMVETYPLLKVYDGPV